MALTITFARHGESTANVNRTFANRPDIPGDLTATGMAQAEALARSLENSGLTHIYTSPLPRARQTAEIVASKLGLSLLIDDRLCEYDVGEDEGFPYTGDDAWRWNRYEEVQVAWRNGNKDARHPGGESLADMERRVLGFMKSLQSHHGEADRVLAVSHGGLLHMALPALFRSLPADIAEREPLRHGDVVIGKRRNDGWACISWGAIEIP